MKELTIEEKIEEIKNTTSYQDVKNAWFPPYHEKEYYFVSYSHKDYKLVYEKLHRLQSGKKRINLWYDHNLTPGKDWEIEARRYIYDFNCKGVIFFLSENAVLSRSIDKEIEFVKESKKTYLSINLPCEKIEGHIGEYLSGQKMLELLKQQGYTIENYEEKSDVLKETFNDKITFLPLNEDIDSQITKILSLKRQPLLELHLDSFFNLFNSVRVVSINNLYAETIEAEDFKYFLNDEKYVLETIIEPGVFANCRWLKKVELPKNLIGVAAFSFFNCTNLPSVTLPDGVMFIGQYAFYGCKSLSNVTLPNSVDSIGDSAFEDCKSLESITLPNSVKFIGDSAFKDCESLESITLPNSVKSIGDSTFEGCRSLESITIPNSVNHINDLASRGCMSLKDVFYKGTKKQWKSIAIDIRITTYTVHCTDADLKKDETID